MVDKFFFAMLLCVSIVVISIVLSRNIICYYNVTISNNAEQERRLARQVENPHLPLLT